ncbi:MAG: hypothetical protein HUU14_03780 [Dehalococcoidia bacterium]|nr:hypothetical protein [Dehalococcoidia bacterium]NUQ54988.1 hypothetical protein [Dehalococcoidia bacterium]
MFAPSLNLDLSRLAQPEEKPAAVKKVAAKGAKTRNTAAASSTPTKKS